MLTRRLLLPVRLVQALAVIWCGLSACACASIDLANPVERREILAVGAVSVRVPTTFGQVRAIDISTLGVGVDTSVFVGWRRGQFVFVQPNECQLLIIVRSGAEAEHATRLLEAAQGGQICMVDFAGALPRSR
jgi:hypothetical protein